MKRSIFLTAAAACLFSCVGGSGGGNGIELLDAAAFRTEIAGKPVALYTLRNENGMTVQLTNYGARVVALWVPAADGTFRDVVWGYDGIAAYLDSTANSAAAIPTRPTNTAARSWGATATGSPTAGSCSTVGNIG